MLVDYHTYFSGCILMANDLELSFSSLKVPGKAQEFKKKGTQLRVSRPVGEVFLPVLYAGSSDHADDEVRLGRMTNWKVVEEPVVLGMGQRLFLVDDDEKAMLEVREVTFETQVAASPQG